MDANDALKLYDLELFELGERASEIRRKLHGDKVFYNRNRQINPTNICSDYCKFCGFSAHRKNPNPYVMGVEEIARTAKEAADRGAKEIHIVSAHNKDVGLEWYFEVFSNVKAALPDIHLKAMTAAEVEFLARTYGKSFEYILDRMIESGVDSMPGGGAEIFDETLRKRLCDGKVKSADWLKIHKLWHERGRKSNATMLFGHIESRAHRIDHLLRLRDLQEITGGFNAFVPLLFQTKNNYIEIDRPLDAEEVLKTIAISRIVLANIPHIKAYWVGLTLKLALVAQEFGADDMDGTIEKESINSAAGAASAGGVAQKLMTDLIAGAGFLPIERDSVYNEIAA
ncbi:MAG: aminofutalosine synthase MqnE [Helicobacteraceae bacterium]|jgi:aminodeoxyfutalosine synthase|nr:aminofutalosine synthase MqnE [Helicobacteraceae bacterium]